jgi:4a-hydroxytetrahydrobiopterin dehydratase
MGKFSQQKCLPCSAGTPPLKGEELKKSLCEIEGWSLVQEKQIEKEFRFKNFKEALDFTNEVGKIAESEGHHPDLLLSWGKVKIMLMTHKIKGLSQNDFILASKIDDLYHAKWERKSA